MKSVIDQRTADMVTKYCTNRMFISVLKDVRKSFLTAVGVVSLAGMPAVVLYLLIVKALQDMIDGYSGRSSYDNSLLDEAVGVFSTTSVCITNPISIILLAESPRYEKLMMLINSLSVSNNEFRQLIQDFLVWDKQNPLQD